MNLLPSQINELLVTLVLGRLCPCGHPGHGRGLGLPGMGLHRFPLPSSPSSRTPHRQCWDECPTPRRQCRDVRPPAGSAGMSCCWLPRNQGAGAACQALRGDCRQPGLRWSQRDPGSSPGSFSMSSWGAVFPAPCSAELWLASPGLFVSQRVIH